MKKINLILRKASIPEAYETETIDLISLDFKHMDQNTQSCFIKFNQYAKDLEEVDEYGDVACYVEVEALENIDEAELEILVSSFKDNQLNYFSFEKTPDASFENIDIWDGVDF